MGPGSTTDGQEPLSSLETAITSPDVEKGLSEGPREDSLAHSRPDGLGVQYNNRLLRVISTKSVGDPGPPPDGGLQAWSMAFMAHFVIFTTWGYINSFGVFQSYYTSTLRQTPSAISWVGSVQIFLIFFIGAFSGRALDAGLFKPIFIAGVVFQTVGIFTTSICREYWQLFLSQGICMGIGEGLQFCPTVALIATYFTKHRNVAIGIAASGTASGGMVIPAIVKTMLPKVGFGWTVRTIGFVNLALGIVTALTLKSRLPPRRAGPLVEWRAFREMPYLLYLLGMFLNFWGLYFGFYYIISFTRDKVGLTYADSINLLIAMNGIGLVGRLLPNFLADRFTGPVTMMVPLAFCSGILIFAWAGVKSVVGAWVFALMYGFFSAGIQGLFPAALSSLTTDQKKAGTRMGMGFSLVSIACLTGPPLAGGLIQLNPRGDYLYAQMWAASSLICGTVVVGAARVAKTGWKFSDRC